MRVLTRIVSLLIIASVTACAPIGDTPNNEPPQGATATIAAVLPAEQPIASADPAKTPAETPILTPEPPPSQAATVYTNDALGFTLTFPAAWDGQYVLHERDNGVTVNFLGESDAARYGYDFERNAPHTGGEAVGTEFFDILADLPAHPLDADSYDLTPIGVVEGVTFYCATSTDDALSVMDIVGNPVAQSDYANARALKENIGDLLDSFRPTRPVHFNDDALSIGQRINIPRMYTVEDIIDSGDGGALLCSTTKESSDMGIFGTYAVRIDRDTNRMWDMIIDDYMYGNLIGGTSTGDGGFLIAYDQHISLIRMDAEGNTLWRQSYENTVGRGQIGELSITPDGGIYVTGFVYADDGGQDGLLLKLDAQGNALWHRTFEDGGDTIFHAGSATPDGGAILAGHTGDYDPASQRSRSYDAFIVRVDINGEELWRKRYGGKAMDMPLALAVVSDGYVFCGKTRSYSGSNAADAPTSAWVFKLDGDGGEVWDRRNGTISEYIDIAEGADGRILLAGNGESNVWVDAMSTDSHILIAYSLYEVAPTYARRMIRTSEGRIWMAGGVVYNEAGGRSLNTMGWVVAME